MIIAGAGGNALDILEFISPQDGRDGVVFYDDIKIGEFGGVDIFGTIDDLCKHPPTRWDSYLGDRVQEPIMNGIGSAGDNTTRNAVYKTMVQAGLKVRSCIFPCKISREVKLGNNLLIGLNSQIHHNCVIGDNCVLGPRVTLCGSVELSENVFVGAGSVVIQGVKIGKNSIVGAGAVVIGDIPSDVTVAGNPAHIIHTK